MLIKNLIYHILIIALLCLIQIILFNQIQIICYINIHIYTIFVLIYPVYSNRFTFIILSFIMGLIIDSFMYSGGIHAFSITLISFLRKDIIYYIAGNNIITEDDLSIFELSFKKQITLVIILMIIYHSAFLLLEVLKINNINIFSINTMLIKTLLGISSNSILSIIYIVILQKKYLS